MAPAADEYERPSGVDDVTVEAVGKLTEALEWVERARGRLYDFHQMIGRADALLGSAADALDDAGHEAVAREIRDEVVGLNVLRGRWTFQVVDEFDEGYYAAVKASEAAARDRLLGGRRHVFEAEMKDRRRTAGRAGHERRPPDST